MGTPKTLEQAIKNGLNEVATRIEFGATPDSSAVIEMHVRDFLAQKFTPDVLDNPKVVALWTRVTGKKIGEAA